MEWYPSKPTLSQVAFGIAFFIALAAVSLHWSLDEADVANRIFLWIVAALLLILASWRVATAIRLVRERRTRQQP